MRERCRGITWITSVLSLAIVAGAMVGCNGSTTVPPQDEVLRLTPVVWAGSPPTNPPLLDHNNWESLATGDVVRTDDAGQAQVQLVGCSGSLYVFKDGAIQVATCLKEEQASGLATCVQIGTAWFNVDCTSRFIVDTPGSRITIAGTAFSVTYMPERRLTLVIVFDGAVTVQPVVDFGTGDLAPDGIRVASGEFLTAVPGLERVEPLPFEALPPLVQELGIRDWIEDIERRAESEDFLPAVWPFREASVTLLTAGGAFDEPTVQRAVLTAIDKEPLLARSFPDQEVAFLAALGGRRIDARQTPYDPELAQALLEEAGYGGGTTAVLLFPARDESLGRMAEAIAQYVTQVGIATKPAPVPAGDLQAQAATMGEAGEPVMWLERR